jgi:uncharacterized delta-60 repeat protein/uncharacterized repeat protein (TIGR01451 family)
LPNSITGIKNYKRTYRKKDPFMKPSLLLLLFVSPLGFVSPLFAAPGDLDTTFDGDGLATASTSDGIESPRGIALQEDGKIVVAGSSRPTAGADADFAVVRFNTDGTLDTSFDSDGIVTTPIGSASDSGEAVAVQEDGKILVGGHARVGSFDDYALARYNTDGSLDTSFSSDGIVIQSIGSEDDRLNGMALQSDGKILVAGISSDGASADLVIVRFNADGTLDTTFDGDGVVEATITGEGVSLAVQGDDKIVIAAALSNGTNFDFALARYTADGSLDSSFDSDGIVTTAVGSGDDVATAVAVQPDGKILAAGLFSNGTDNDIGLVRYNADGSLDTSFGSNGKTTTSISANEDFPSATGFQEDGKILVAGAINTPSTDDLILIRYNADGSLDTTFGGDGIVTSDLVSTENYRLAIQDDGKILVEGPTPARDVFAVLRFLGDTADLSLAKTSDAASAAVGGTVTYTITVTNNGPEAAGGVTVSDTLPAGVAFGSAGASQGTCSGATTVTCDLGTVAASGTATVTITVTVDAAGNIENTATVTGQAVDSDSSNNSATASVTVEANGGGGCQLLR